MTRNQILVIIVIILLAINTVSHISSPVYKFYKENIARIDKSNEQFRNEIKLQLIPAITNLAFNLDQTQLYTSSSVSNSVSCSSLTPVQLPVRNLDFSYFISDNKPQISIGGFTFQIGDNFDSSPIVNISYYSFSTLNAIYHRGGDKNDLFDSDK